MLLAFLAAPGSGAVRLGRVLGFGVCQRGGLPLGDEAPRRGRGTGGFQCAEVPVLLGIGVVVPSWGTYLFDVMLFDCFFFCAFEKMRWHQRAMRAKRRVLLGRAGSPRTLFDVGIGLGFRIGLCEHLQRVNLGIDRSRVTIVELDKAIVLLHPERATRRQAA